MTVRAVFPVVITDHLAASRDFYAGLLELRLAFETDWYVQLISSEAPAAQLGLVLQGHDSVPPVFAHRPAGVLVTIEVDDVDAVHARAVAAGLPIELPLRSEDWGQRHFITRDPDGLAVDVVQIIPVTSESLAAGYAPDLLPR